MRIFTIAVVMALALVGIGHTTTNLQAQVHEGILVSRDSDRLVIVDRENSRHVLVLADNTSVTIDGKTARADLLQVGMGVRALCQVDDPTKIARIEARSRQ